MSGPPRAATCAVECSMAYEGRAQGGDEGLRAGAVRAVHEALLRAMDAVGLRAGVTIRVSGIGWRERARPEMRQQWAGEAERSSGL